MSLLKIFETPKLNILDIELAARKARKSHEERRVRHYMKRYGLSETDALRLAAETQSLPILFDGAEAE